MTLIVKWQFISGRIAFRVDRGIVVLLDYTSRNMYEWKIYYIYAIEKRIIYDLFILIFSSYKFINNIAGILNWFETFLLDESF